MTGRLPVPPPPAVGARPPGSPSRVPVTTYRLQFNRSFTFRDAAALADYLSALGITEIYASPLLMATPGSAHGYDISDHSRLNPDLGTDEDFEAFVHALREHGLGLVLDFVPNHMGISPRTNPWWRDVLENGPSSPWAGFFDIDWDPVKPELRDKVLLPILGDQYGLALERGELRLLFERGALTLTYFDHWLPINPRQATRVYRVGLDVLRAELGDADPDVRELLSILTALDNLPVYTERDSARIVERQREKEVARERLERLTERSARVRDHIESAVRLVNGTPGDRASFDRLHELLEVQAYRLAYWRTAFDEINYRRFFDVNELAALRMEDPRVREATHGRLLDLVAQGAVTGVRIDHPDGLFDPAGYFAWLQQAARERGAGPVYVLAEKILSHGERLRADWSIHGTTGYDFLNLANGLFVHSASLEVLRRTYRRFAGERDRLADAVYAAKRTIMLTTMAGELQVLAHALNRLSEGDRRSRDFTLNSLLRALREVIACFPVYRTYVTPEGATADDERLIDRAIADARRRNPVMEPSIFAFLREALLPRPAAAAATSRLADARVTFGGRFQQYTGPVQAKGLEDTAFYRKVPLISTNEVGGDAHHVSRSVEEFHAANAERLRDWPLSMTTTSTHDTKRGEDARARINVLSELPDAWRRHAGRWARLNASHRTAHHGTVAPDRNDEWLFYQSLIGSWPAESLDAPLPRAAPGPLVERLVAYMLKAVREAKRHTSWASSNQSYEDGVTAFVRDVLVGSTAARFLESFLPLQRVVAWFGWFNSLAQLLLKITVPGVPDFYQGTELWELSLVDPDNRGQVDYRTRRALLASLAPLAGAASRETPAASDARAAACQDMLDTWWDGRSKLYTMAAALAVRRAHADLFLGGSYEPLSTSEPAHLVAFARRAADLTLVTVVPRLLATKLRGQPRLPLGPEVWRDERIFLGPGLDGATFVDAFTGEAVSAASGDHGSYLSAGDVLARWPVALLATTAGASGTPDQAPSTEHRCR